MLNKFFQMQQMMKKMGKMQKMMAKMGGGGLGGLMGRGCRWAGSCRGALRTLAHR